MLAGLCWDWSNRLIERMTHEPAIAVARTNGKTQQHWRHADLFKDMTTPNWITVLSRLAAIEQCNKGVLDADSLGQKRYEKLLARTLADTLDDAVKSVIAGAKDAQLNQTLLMTASLTGLMMSQNINQILIRDGVFSSRENISEMSGLTR